MLKLTRLCYVNHQWQFTTLSISEWWFITMKLYMQSPPNGDDSFANN